MHSDDNKAQGLLVIFLDMLGLIVSAVAAKYFWTMIVIEENMGDNFKESLAYSVAIFLLSYILVCVFVSFENNLLNRKLIDELFYCVRMNFFVFLVVTLLLFVVKNGDIVSRGASGVTVLINTILMVTINSLIKSVARKQLKGKGVLQMLVVTSSDRVDSVLDQLTKSNEWGRRIAGICILDDERQGQEINGIPVVANYYDVVDYVKKNICDEVLIHIPYTSGKNLKDFINSIEEMGIKVYVNINLLDGVDAVSSRVSYVHGYPVVEFTTKTFPWNMLFIKRIIDICGALVGLLITAVVTIFVAPPLLIESPGPLFFKQKRVGRNGRYFMIYKFRSMYMDAEERKKELMAQNEMKGAMFKMTNDPRVTKVGKFIRATSIDELPQFWNVLKGDMSLVGTRPPTVEEFKEYSPYHKRRLSLKPGLTGMWQVSGRSDIEDFEEVVKLDLKYIDNWSIGLDIKIILKTIWVVFARVGSK